MPRKLLQPGETCPRCDAVHVTSTGANACVAHKRSTGAGCKLAPIKGSSVCASHGAAKGTATRRKAAERVVEEKARREMFRLGRPVEINPAEALVQEVQWTAGHVEFLRGRVEQLFGEDPSKLVWGEVKIVDKGSGKDPGWELYERERDRLVAVSVAALKAGVEERRLHLAQQQGNQVAEALKAIFTALQLSASQWEMVPKVVPLHLRAITGGNP